MAPEPGGFVLGNTSGLPLARDVLALGNGKDLDAALCIDSGAGGWGWAKTIS